MQNLEFVLENEMHKLFWDFDIQTDHLISTRRLDRVIVNEKKKRTCRTVDFAVLADHREKIKENEKRGKYLDLGRELKKKLCNLKVAMIAIVIGVFGTIPQNLVGGGSWRS